MFVIRRAQLMHKTIIFCCYFVDKFSKCTVPVYTKPILDLKEFEDTKGVIRIHNSKKDRQRSISR